MQEAAVLGHVALCHIAAPEALVNDGQIHNAAELIELCAASAGRAAAEWGEVQVRLERAAALGKVRDRPLPWNVPWETALERADLPRAVRKNLIAAIQSVNAPSGSIVGAVDQNSPLRHAPIGALEDVACLSTQDLRRAGMPPKQVELVHEWLLFAGLGVGARVRPNLLGDLVQRTNAKLVHELQAVAAVGAGIALGDALGLPHEGKSPGEMEAVLAGGLKFHSPCLNAEYAAKPDDYPIGSTSDETAMSLLVGASLARDRGYAQDTIADAHLKLLDKDTTGFGCQTLRALQNLRKGEPASVCGLISPDNDYRTGNGVVIKLPFLALYYCAIGRRLDDPRTWQEVFHLTALTHKSTMGLAASYAHLAALLYCLHADHESFNPNSFFQGIFTATTFAEQKYPSHDGIRKLSEKFAQVFAVSDHDSPGEMVERFNSPTSDVYQCLPLVYYSFARSITAGRSNDVAREALTRILLHGGNTDAIGSMTGALVGCLFRSPFVFPGDLVEGLDSTGDIFTCSENFFARFVSRNGGVPFSNGKI